MEDFIWRTKARVVAYVDVVVTMIALMVIVCLVALVGHEEMVRVDTSEQLKRIWGIVVALSALINGLQLWASFKLLSATEYGKDAYEALKMARFWRTMTFVFLVMIVLIIGLCGLGVIVGANPVPSVGVALIIGIGYIIWCGGSMFTVYKYMKELETTLPSGGTAAGDVCSEWVYCAGEGEDCDE